MTRCDAFYLGFQCTLLPGHTGFHMLGSEAGPLSSRTFRNEDTSTPSMQAVKSDGYKVRLELITPTFLAALGRVLTFGASKYAAHNWTRGFDWSRLIGAIERHVQAFKGGEDWDPETGEHHLAHAACETMFLLEHATRGLGKDDRLKLPVELPVPADVLERRAAALAKARAPAIEQAESKLRDYAARRAAGETGHGICTTPYTGK